MPFSAAFFASMQSKNQITMPAEQPSPGFQVQLDVNLPDDPQLSENPPDRRETEMELYHYQHPDDEEQIAEAHRNRLELSQEIRADKGTDPAYSRHVKNYEKFISSLAGVECHPITPVKVNLFLKYESTRNKRSNKGEEKRGTSLGQIHIRQAISALQRYIRDHEHEPVYANSPITRLSLRSHQMIRIFEDHSRKGSHKRRLDAHTLKARGTSSDAYKTQEVTKMSLWCLRSFGPSNAQIHLGLRDRAMLLLSTNIAFRGDSTRQVLWSDLFAKSQPMPTISKDAELDALVIIADQAKTNSVGRIDEHALFRHREVELCGYGGLAFYFFGIFHLLKKEIPDFSPDFDDPDHTELGRRDWYSLHVFPGNGTDGQKDGMTPMTYENHRARVLAMHMRNGISVSHVTHCGRFHTATKAANYGASGLDIKALGNWKTGDAYSEIYMRTLPVSAMLASAMFNAQKPEEYNLPRAILDPPADLLSTIFPWVESQQALYAARLEEYGTKAEDPSLKHFLELLIQFRKVIVQDAAILYIRYPELPLWKHAPFDTTEFKVFAMSSVAAIQLAEQEARHKLENLPGAVASTLNGILQTQGIQQAQQFLAIQEWQARQERAAEDRFSFLERFISTQTSSRRKRTQVISEDESARQSLSQMPSGLTPAPVPVPTINIMGSPNSDNMATRPSPLPSLSENLASALNLSENTSDESSWPEDLKDFRPNFLLAREQSLREEQLNAIRDLIKKYGNNKIAKHQFDWISSHKTSIPDGWLPIYRYSTNVKTIRDIWKEFTEGLDGQFSVRQLEEEWGARWRRNVDGQKTEATRRNVLIKIITSLAQKPHWTVHLALEYLDYQYPIPCSPSGPAHLRSPRAFINYLQNKTEGARRREEVMENAAKYTK